MTPQTPFEPASNSSQTFVEVESNPVEPGFEDVAPISERDRTTGRYTNVQIADDLGTSDTSIRNWFSKVREVCPLDWLKVNDKHTDLSAALLADYATRVSRGAMAPDVWIVEMRGQFELPTATVEALPADTSLALRSNAVTATALDAYLEEMGVDILEATQRVDAFMDDLEASEAELLQAEIEAARKRGAQRAVLRYAAEKQAENETAQALRQREIERRRQGGQQG